MAARVACIGAGVAVGYCLPKIPALSPFAEPIEQTLQSLVPKPKVELSYFNVPGRAEMIRWTFAIGGVAFDDLRISQEEWPALKPSILTGHLPAARVAGSRPYAESHALLRFAGRLTGLYPTDPVKALAVDEVLGVMEDFTGDMFPLTAMEPAFKQVTSSVAAKQKAAVQAAVCEDTLPKHLQTLETLLEHNGTGWFVGTAPTIADVAVASIVRVFTTGFAERWGFSKDVPKAYPKLMAMCESLEALPPVRKWLEDHPGS
mmetsp:Transcript_11349/g.38696  ORF Transcript_11349/g.38696 Transcript_11349/m.38696 type:complete len:260 (-) Transcript_11349:607-1386(-)